MKVRGIHIAAGAMMGLLLTGATGAADQPITQTPYAHSHEDKLPNGMIGVSLQVGAEHIGDPAVLYVGMVHPEGPAHQAGLRHGDEVMAVDGTAVSEKIYEQVIKMIRGESGTIVKLGIKGDDGTRELSIIRMAGDKRPKSPTGSHGRSTK
jgi:C-terminal processing protease CtpA/Prc